MMIDQFEFEISCIVSHKLRPHIFIVGENGDVIEWDLKTNKQVSEYQLLVFSRILFAFFHKAENEMFVLKEAGNLEKVNYKSRTILEEKIINEDQITLHEFCEKTMTLFTASKQGVIVMTTINNRNEIEYEEILDKG